jgi:hypothetical protein
LQAVDRGVGRIMTTLNNLGLLSNTTIVFASDNGYEWGEHGGLRSKVKEYEESLKVPLVIRDPMTANLGARNSSEFASWNLDLAKTIFNLANVNGSYSRGTDLTPILRGQAHSAKTEIIFQAYGKDDGDGGLPIYAAVRDGNWKYVELGTGEKELYNLSTDPWELVSLHNNSTYASLMSSLSSEIDPYRGLTILTTTLVNATHGFSYTATLQKWGGNAPFTWSMYNSTSLPPGLTLSASTGVISGTPTTVGRYTFGIKLEDSSSAPLTGFKERHVVSFTLNVN